MNHRNAASRQLNFDRVFLFILFILAFPFGACDGAHAPAGRFVPPEQFESNTLSSHRTLRIWLPPSYDSAPSKRYPVLYLHDGQNVLSSAGPHVAFGWGNWEVDRTVVQRVAERRMREIILVAIDNTSERYPEYRGRTAPSAATERESERQVVEPGDNSAYERYASFLTKELKPAVDRRYRTLADAAHTALMGSSMGGICSLALAWDHPEVFGLAASLSGAFQVEKSIFLSQTLKTYSGPPKPFKIYLDSGARSLRDGDDGKAKTEAVTAELRRIGWKDGVDLLYFLDAQPLTPEQLAPLNLPQSKFKEAQTSQHNELYWRLRVWRPLEFLFPPEP